MTKSRLTFAALFVVGTLGCSSSTNEPKDSGTPSDGGHDAGADAVVDHAMDAPVTDGGGGGDADASVDVGFVQTALQVRGDYLVNHVIACPDCHTPRKADGSPDFTKFLAGDPGFVTLPNGDKLGTKNLTNDSTGLKNFTDAEIKDMFLNGKLPAAMGGGALNPTMPYYVLHNMTAEDADAIVAYLRTVPAISNTIPRRGVSFDVPGPANPLDPAKIPLPLEAFPARDSALRGRYLAAESGLCVECHTEHQMMSADVLLTSKIFAGGEDFSSLFGNAIHPVSKNLTSDVATGLGTWAASDIVNVLLKGVAKDGTGICPPMPVGPMGAFGGLHADDAMDIANYIKSLPPITNLIVDMCVFPPPQPTDGGTAASGDASGNSPRRPRPPGELEGPVPAGAAPPGGSGRGVRRRGSGRARRRVTRRACARGRRGRGGRCAGR